MALKKKKASKISKLKSAETETSTKQKRKGLGYTKWLGIGVMMLCVEVIFYAEIYLWHFTRLGAIADISSLYILIVSVVGAVISAVVAIAFKSKAENTEGGIVYETAMMEMSQTFEPPSTVSSDNSSGDGGCG
jgi:hypothetical protein